MSYQDPFQNIFGNVRLIVDKIRELENFGQMYGLSRYLKDAIIVVKTQNFPILCEVFIPQFLFYFQFLLNKDPKTYQIYVEDFRVVYPISQTPLEETQPEEEVEGEIEDDSDSDD